MNEALGSTMLTFADLEKPLSFSSLFGNENPVELEIGAGRGDFLCGYAAARPNVNFLAVERKANYLKRGVNKCEKLDLENVVFLNVEARHFLEGYIAPASLQAVHIYFPDPWPKKKHLRRRFVQAESIAIIRELLVPDGILYFRTDHAHYFEQMTEVMNAQTGYQRIDDDPEVLRHETGFEKRFRAVGLPIYSFTFRKTEKVAALSPTP